MRGALRPIQHDFGADRMGCRDNGRDIGDGSGCIGAVRERHETASICELRL